MMFTAGSATIKQLYNAPTEIVQRIYNWYSLLFIVPALQLWPEKLINILVYPQVAHNIL